MLGELNAYLAYLAGLETEVHDPATQMLAPAHEGLSSSGRRTHDVVSGRRAERHHRWLGRCTGHARDER